MLKQNDPIANLLGDLTYRTYAHNRDTSPDITPRSWKKVFGYAEVDAMEARYQADRAIQKAKS